MFEYAVVIRRQPKKSPSSWQLWLASGMEFEGPLFLPVMNHAGALGFEAVSAGHFDELAVPEILLQRRVGSAPLEIQASAAVAGEGEGGDGEVPSRPAGKSAVKAATPKSRLKKPAAKRS